MSRLSLTACALALLMSPAIAADPQPLWSIETSTDKTKSRGAWCVRYSPDGKMIYANAAFVTTKRFEVDLPPDSNRLIAWDAGTRKKLFEKEISGNRLLAPNLAPSGAGTVLVTSSTAVEVRVTDQMTRDLGIRGVPVGVWFDPKDRRAAWLFHNDEFSPYRVGFGEVTAFVADPKGRRQVQLDYDSAVLPPPVEKWLPVSFAVNPDLTLIAIGARGEEDTLSLYSIKSGVKLKFIEKATVMSPHRGAISTIQFSGDGKTLATGSFDSSTALWDVSRAGKEWKPYAVIPGGNFTVSGLAFSPNGRTLAAGTFDSKGRSNLYMIDVQGGKLVSSHRLKDRSVCSLAYSPDNMTLITGDNLGTIQAWNAAAIRGD